MELRASGEHTITQNSVCSFSVCSWIKNCLLISVLQEKIILLLVTYGLGLLWPGFQFRRWSNILTKPGEIMIIDFEQRWVTQHVKTLHRLSLHAMFILFTQPTLLYQVRKTYRCLTENSSMTKVLIRYSYAFLLSTRAQGNLFCLNFPIRFLTSNHFKIYGYSQPSVTNLFNTNLKGMTHLFFFLVKPKTIIQQSYKFNSVWFIVHSFKRDRKLPVSFSQLCTYVTEPACLESYGEVGFYCTALPTFEMGSVGPACPTNQFWLQNS